MAFLLVTNLLLMINLSGMGLRMILYCCLALTTLAAGFNYQLDAWADHSIRVRVTPANVLMRDAPVRGLLPHPPKLETKTKTGENSLENGNLKVAVDPSNGRITAIRISDGKVLLKQTRLTIETPAVKTDQADAFASTISFEGHGKAERIYGLGGSISVVYSLKAHASWLLWVKSKTPVLKSIIYVTLSLACR